MRARLTAAGLFPGPAAGGRSAEPADIGEPTSARVAAARSRADERQDRQRQMLRPLGWVLIAVVVAGSLQGHPGAGLQGIRLGISLALAGYAVAVAAAIAPTWARRGLAFQATMIGLIGGCGVALAALQPHGPGQLAASMGVWIAAVRLATPLAVAAAGAITAALAVTVGLTQHPAAQSVIAATLLCLVLGLTGQFIRRGRESQDRTELLMAQLQDARDAEAAAAALAERSRIAGELHDVLAHSLSGLAIQLQGARKLAERESASAGLRGAIERSAELTKAGLADARQAVGALRGDRLPTLDQLGALVEDFRRDTGADATLRVEGTSRPLPAEASLALFRGAQEALTNIARYAPGATVTVTVCHQPERTILTVEDHARCLGDGTAQSSRPVVVDAPVVADAPVLAGAGGGHGLTAMRERAQRAGGTARAGPTADGWLVELEVPA
jgi:signal transduction histidine kinase